MQLQPRAWVCNASSGEAEAGVGQPGLHGGFISEASAHNREKHECCMIKVQMNRDGLALSWGFGAESVGRS